MQADLDSEPVDWEQIYTDIQLAGVTDPGFHSENFGHQTIALIEKVCSGISKKLMAQANAANYSAAYICALYFGGEIKKYLPYQIDEEKEKPNRVTKATAEAFRKANKEGLIPMGIVSAFTPYIDEIMRLTK